MWIRQSRFHPFQGRPLFGRRSGAQVRQGSVGKFPSLSGKTSIRTWVKVLLTLTSTFVSIPFREDLYSDRTGQARICADNQVSIPFREDLYSDVNSERAYFQDLIPRFPSLSGKTSIRTYLQRWFNSVEEPKVSIPFREDLYSDYITFRTILRKQEVGFHPFQGRPLFGLRCQGKLNKGTSSRFPSLSGKTSIRTRQDWKAGHRAWGHSFHPFQGRPLFGLWKQLPT